MDPDEPTDLPSTEASPQETTKGQRVGPYRLLQKLGEGGMGEVWEAEQTEPVRRKVALKLIKWGMDTKAVVARFEAERQALAMMNHPNVAKVSDAGATEQGRPYFAMELVKGESITKYCYRQRLTTKERLELFMQVCEGVQHAHQKGIIHRDLKPSNVLVLIEGDKPVPKIIDFGVAKATEQRLTERTVFTELGQLIGTPEYMSPEQAEMTVQDIDTRTDVYSLGVMLYQLLVGALPFDPKELRQAGFDEIRRRIREEEPSRPSTRFSSLGAESTGSAKARRTDPASLVRQLRGDLDWITMNALEKDRTRRYGSTSELAADIERHLTSQPVLAGPPSVLYRARKFVRRHGFGVGVTAVLLALLVGFAVRERIQSTRVAREAETARQVSDFLVRLFEVSDPSEARGNSVTAREILDRGATEIEETLSDRPELQARLMGTMGNVYRNLGLYPEAEELLEQALEGRERVLDRNHRETLESRADLAGLYVKQGRYDEAEAPSLAVLTVRRQTLGAEHPDTLTALNDLALVYELQGRYDEAEPLFLESLETRRRVLGENDPATLNAMDNLANLYLNQGRYDEAQPIFVETLDTREAVLGGDHPRTLESMGALCLLYIEQGRLDDALPLCHRTLESRRRILGVDHPDTLVAMNDVAYLYMDQGRYDEAEPLYREALDTFRRTLGEDHPYTLTAMNNLAVLYKTQGRYAEAEPLFREDLRISRRVMGEDHPDTLISMGNLGELYFHMGRLAEAEPLLTEAVAGVRSSALPHEHIVTGYTIRKNGACLAAMGRYQEAEQLLLEAHEILVAAVGTADPEVRLASRNLVALYDAWGRPEEAARWKGEGAPED
jgi:non-specific serine/threonine protein kinase/serine/threonine-protein kinase